MKYWKALTAAAMLLGLTACGGGGGDDKNDAPPPAPGDAGSVVFTAKTPELATLEDGKGQLSVEFTLKDANGNPVDVGNEVINFSVTKLIPGRMVEGQTVPDPAIWKAFIYSSKFKADFEKSTSGELKPLGNGSYRYSFATDFNNVTDPYPSDSTDNGGIIAWDKDKLHRLAVHFGGTSTASGAMPLVNYTLDWVPSGLPAELTRDILEQSSCDSCHMGEPIHHKLDVANNRTPKGYDPKLCVNCHNESNPATSRLSLTAIVHAEHGAVGLDGVNQTPYPQDARNCDTCHKDETVTTPDADNWMVSNEKPCAACHKEVDFTNHKGYNPATKPCESCHTEGTDATKSASVAHMGRMANEAMGRDKIAITFDNVSFIAPNIEVEMTVTVDGVPAETHEDLLKFVDGGMSAAGLGSKPYVLVNVDKGEGFELGYSGGNMTATNQIKFKDCVAQGGGKFHCSKAVNSEVTGDLAATVAEFNVCVARKNDKNGAFAAGDLLPCDNTSSSKIAINPTNAYYHATGGENSDYVLKVGATMASCDGCHKELVAHGTSHAAKDFAQCTSCHNAARTSYHAGEPGDLKYLAHRFHSSSGAPDAGVFPGKVNNCESCHTKEQYNLPNQKNVRPSSAGTADAPKFFSPTLVACGSCHLQSPLANVNPDSPVAGDEWASHMKENGAVFGAATMEAATGTEQCADCHAVGQEQGVDKVHKVYDFR